MSSMAEEIAARMAADGATPPATGGAPGNEGVQPTPPAGASNTDTATPGSAAPETVPYARFKEVNDKYNGLRPYEALESFGYDADALQRLAAFEQAYNSDPIGVWRSMALNLDLPAEIVQAIDTHYNGGSGTGGATPAQAQAQLQGDTPPASNLTEEERELLEWAKSARGREEEGIREQKLDSLLAAWDALDEQAGITTGTRTKLTWISAALSGNRFDSIEEAARAAWDARMQERDTDLGVVVRRPGNGTASPALPGGLPVPTPPVKFGSLRDATEAAKADILAGRPLGSVG